MKPDLSIWNEIVNNGAYSTELDWFGIDKKGNIAVFTALMNAPIPESVKSSFENYSNLFDYINSMKATTGSQLITLEKGDFQVWLRYARKGLYAYDFQDVHRAIPKKQYDLIAKPDQPLNISDLDLSSTVLAGFFKIDADFNEGNISLIRIY